MRKKAPWSAATKKALMVRRYGELSDFVAAYRKKHRGNLPWAKAYFNARARCGNPREPKYKYYGGRGIRCFLTLADVRVLYIRDRAHLLAIPSLDRINVDQDYSLLNCRFIEFADNRVATRRNKRLTQPA